jgi:hypothetical protein
VLRLVVQRANPSVGTSLVPALCSGLTDGVSSGVRGELFDGVAKAALDPGTDRETDVAALGSDHF